MSGRIWVSIITVFLLGLIIYLAWGEIVHAWVLLTQINIWILALLIPVQIMAYFAAGEMMFSYLRAKHAMKKITLYEQARMALEMNFVNHVLPSGGVSGISYMNWRLKPYDISAGRATAAQFVRYAAQFAAYIVLLLLAVIWITLDGNMNRWVILLSIFIVLMMTLGTVLIGALVSSKSRSEWFAEWLVRALRRVVRAVTFGRIKLSLAAGPIASFFIELHDEYETLRRDQRLLLKPFLWGLLFNLLDVALFTITFWALGTPVSPAPILIAYGLASIAAIIAVTPGGAGVYEAIMVSFLATAGIGAGVAIAGTLVTRVIVLIGTIGLGYAFYQHAILRHGKRPDPVV